MNKCKKVQNSTKILLEELAVKLPSTGQSKRYIDSYSLKGWQFSMFGLLVVFFKWLEDKKGNAG